MFIKKTLFFIVLVVSFFLKSEAQSVFKTGDIGINAGIGMGWQYQPSYHRINSVEPIPSINGSVDIGVYEIPDVGVISIGGIFSFRKAWDDGRISGINYNYTFFNTFIAGRAAFHLGFFDSKGFDVYTGMQTGIWFWRDNYEDPYTDISDNGSKFFHDFFIGGRYLLTENVGFFIELGYGISYFKTGLSLLI